jgi:hypothetical protein
MACFGGFLAVSWQVIGRKWQVPGRFLALDGQVFGA